jgi:hypothetical protein
VSTGSDRLRRAVSTAPPVRDGGRLRCARRRSVKVALRPATADGWSGDARTYFGPSTVTASTAEVTEVKAAGDYEAVLTWVVGLRAKVPFRVLVLDGPPRLVVDFQH